MFSAQFLGKHLLLFLLTIALAGAIGIAAVPGLRGPVTDYFGEKFGPKADVTDDLPADTVNLYAPMTITPRIVSYGDKVTVNIDNKVPSDIFTVNTKYSDPCMGMINPGQFNYSYNPNANCAPIGLKVQLPFKFTKQDLADENIEFIYPSGVNPPDIGYSGTFYSYPYLSMKDSSYFNTIYFAGYYAKIVKQGTYQVIFKISPDTALKPSNYAVNMIMGSPQFSYYSYVINQGCSEKYSNPKSPPLYPEYSYYYEMTSQKDCRLGLNTSDFKATSTVYFNLSKPSSSIKLTPVDPNDDAKTKTTAKADGQDKIKVKIDFKNGDGTINNAQNVQVYASAGKLSMTGDADKFSSYSADSTLSLLGNREFYILGNKAEKATISAKTLDQEGQELLASTEVEFKEPILTHEVDKTEADNDGKDYITYTLTVFDVDGITPLADQTVDMSFIMNKGEIEESQFSDFSYSQKFETLKNEKEEILSDLQLLEGLKTDDKGKVSLYIRSKDNSQVKLTGLLHFADRTIGTNDKDFKSIAFKGARIVLTGEDKTKYTYTENNVRTSDNIQTLKLKFTDKDNNPIKNTKINFLVSTKSDNLDKSCIIEKLDSAGNLQGLPVICNQSSDDLVTDINSELTVGISTKLAGKLSITAQGTKDKLISSNTVDIEYIAENLTLIGKTTAPANAKVPIVLAAEFSSTDAQSKKIPKISFEISPKNKNMEIKLNNEEDWENWYETETDWINTDQLINKSMFKKDDNYARSITIRTDIEGEYEITATVTLDNGKSYQEKKTLKFLESETTIKPTKITREVNGKTVSLDFQKTKDSQTPIFPGDLVKFEVSSKYNDKQLTMQVNLPENVQMMKDSLESGEYIDANRSIFWLNFSDPITFEVRINPKVPIKTTDLKFTARLICSDPDELIEILISESSVDVDIWSKVKGQVTEPYAIQNGSFVLSDQGNRPVQNMEIELLNGANVKISGKETITTDLNGNFIFEFARKNLADDNQVKYQLKLNVFNNKLFADLANMDRLITVTGSDRTLVSEGFALEDLDITNQDFKIREKNSEPKIQKTGFTEENKTLLSVINNILEAMKITKKYRSGIKYQTLSINSQQNIDQYNGGNNITLSSANSTNSNRTLKLFNNRSAIPELHEFSHYLMGTRVTTLQEAFALANSLYLGNEILHGQDYMNWSHRILLSDGVDYDFYNLIPAFEDNLYDSDVSAASVFHLLTTGFMVNSLPLNLPTLKLRIVEGKDVWFDSNLGMSFPTQTSYANIEANTDNFYYLIFNQQPGNMSDFFNYALKIPDWNQNITGSNLSLIRQLYIFGGLFSDTNNNKKYDEGENFGSTATGTSRKQGLKPARMPLRVENSYLKINLLSPSGLSQDYINYLNVLVDSNNKDSIIQLVDENGHLVDTSSKFVFSNNNGLLYLTPSPEEYKEKIYITSSDSADHIVLDADKLRQAVESANTNNTGNGYVAEVNFNIQTADSEKGILAATPPSLEQMQAIEAERQAEIDKIRQAQIIADKIKALEAELAQAKANQAQAEIIDLENQLAQAQKDSEIAKKDYQQKLIDLVKSQNEKLTQTQADYQQAADDLITKYTNLIQEKQDLVKTQDEMLKSQTEKDQKIESLNSQLQTNNDQIKELTVDLDKKNIIANQYQLDKKTLEDQLADQQTSKQTVQAAITQLKLAILKVQNSFNNYQIQDLKDQIADREYQDKYLQSQLALIKTQDQVKDITEQYLEGDKRNQELMKQIKNLEADISKLEDQIAFYQSKLDDLQTKLPTSLQKQTELNQEQTNMQIKLATATSIWEELKLGYQLSINNYQTKLAKDTQTNLEKEQTLAQTKLENLQQELKNQKLAIELKQKEQELLIAEQEETQQELDNQTSINQDLSQTNKSLLDQEITKKDQDIVKIENDLQKEENQFIDAEKDKTTNQSPILQTPTIIIEPTTDSSTQETIKEATLAKVTVNTSTDQTNNDQPVITTTSFNQETPEIKAQKDSLIVEAKNFTTADKVTLFIDNKEINATPIASEDFALKTNPEETKNLSLGEHTLTIKDDLGNQANSIFQIRQNAIFNPTNYIFTFGSLIILILGFFGVKLGLTKLGIAG